MKPVFKKTALDRLMEIVADARCTLKKLDYILVTPEEWDELRCHCGPSIRYDQDASLQDAVIETVERPNPAAKHSPHRIPYVRFMVQPWRILGQRIVVAPIEYH